MVNVTVENQHALAEAIADNALEVAAQHVSNYSTTHDVNELARAVSMNEEMVNNTLNMVQERLDVVEGIYVYVSSVVPVLEENVTSWRMLPVGVGSSQQLNWQSPTTVGESLAGSCFSKCTTDSIHPSLLHVSYFVSFSAD